MVKTLLVTNDDGIDAPGIWTLVNSLTAFYDITVVAPHKDQSGTSSSVSIKKPIHTTEIDPLPYLTFKSSNKIRAYSVEGTPADSCIVGIECIHESEGIDLVISGINRGANLGWDTLVSGTVGAAMQGYVRGISAIAVSVTAIENTIYTNAADFTLRVITGLLKNPNNNPALININVPNLEPSEIKGIDITKLGERSWAESITKIPTKSGVTYQFARDRKIFQNAIKGTDLYSIENNRISVTPMSIDLSDKSSNVSKSLSFLTN